MKAIVARAALVLGFVLPGSGAGPALRAADHDVASLAATARRAGMRVLEGRHVVVATDRPARDGDGIDDLPRLFDEAFTAWCDHFRIDPAAHGQWRCFGCLIVDKERFRAAGLLPDTVPDFRHGFCDRNRFWLMDQSNPAYRRHLFLHEGVHAFTICMRDLDAPPWYAEGIAELLATHRLEKADDGPPRLVVTPMPQAAEDVEQLGRIEELRRLRIAGRSPSLDDVFAIRGSVHGDLAAYASSWAAVAMLSLHPRHAARFAAAEQGPLDGRFTDRLAASPGWDPRIASRDFDAFTDDVDYGYDVSRSAIDWSPGTPLVGDTTIAVAADRGWQNSGLAVERGGRVTFRGTGRVTVGTVAGRALESEPEGISIDWYRGRPLGRLIIAQWVEPEDGTRPRFVALAEAAAGEFTAAADGPLFLKINEAPGSLADNGGEFRVAFEPAP